MKRTATIAITATLLAAGIAALAAGPFSNPNIVEALNLTPEQQRKLEDLRYQQRKEAADLRRDMELKRLDLQRELDRDTPNTAAVDRLLDEQGALRTKLGKAKIHHMLDMKKILTPEQWSKVKDRMQARRAERMGNRLGRRGPGRGARQGLAPGGPGEGGGRGFGRPDGPPPQGGPAGPGPGGPQVDGEGNEAMTFFDLGD